MALIAFLLTCLQVYLTLLAVVNLFLWLSLLQSHFLAFLLFVLFAFLSLGVLPFEFVIRLEDYQSVAQPGMDWSSLVFLLNAFIRDHCLHVPDW